MIQSNESAGMSSMGWSNNKGKKRKTIPTPKVDGKELTSNPDMTKENSNENIEEENQIIYIENSEQFKFVEGESLESGEQSNKYMFNIMGGIIAPHLH